MTFHGARSRLSARFPQRAAADFLASIAAAAFAAWLCLRYGRIGFMPLDQSIVFDGAWRVAGGEVPYRDFFMPAGLVPVILQAALFGLLGVTWFAYCLHAALANAVYSVVAYVALRREGLSTALSLLFAAMTGVVAYTPFGVPAADQHALLFVLIALVAAREASREPASRALLWAAVPPLMALALFSKQTQAALALPLLAALLFGVRNRRRACWILAASSAAVVALVWVAGALAGVAWPRFFDFFWRLPARHGMSRWSWLLPWRVGRRLLELSMPSVLVQCLLLAVLAPAVLGRGRQKLQAALSALAAAATVALAVTLVWSWPTASRGGKWMVLVAAALVLLVVTLAPRLRQMLAGAVPPALTGREPAWLLAAGAGLLGLCLASMLLTLNEAWDCVPLLYVGAGLTCLALQRLAAAAQGAGASGTARALQAAAAGFVALCVVESAAFNALVNRTRSVHVAPSAVAGVVPGARIAAGLEYMQWLELPTLQARDYTALLRFLAENDGSFFLLGDSTVLYALSNRPSPHPALWFHEGLATPRRGSALFGWYEARLIHTLERLRCRYLVLEGAGTAMGTQLAHLPRLRAMVSERERGRHAFGRFVVVELSPAAEAEPAAIHFTP